MRIRLALLLALVATACLFSTDTKGLKCTKDEHCQAGQVCVAGTCSSGEPASEGTGSDSGESGAGSSGSGSSG